MLEAIIFRVARILEEFRQIAPLRCIYLSGGLSELPCLQQGIALCSGLEVYKLEQKDASLQGAAMLAAGLPLTEHGEARRVEIPFLNSNLKYKYARWKLWLDGLLGVAVN